MKKQLKVEHERHGNDIYRSDFNEQHLVGCYIKLYGQVGGVIVNLWVVAAATRSTWIDAHFMEFA